MMIESVQDVGGMLTKCVSFEREIGNDFKDVNFMVLLIPGNPGIADFYYEFMTQLSSLFKEKFVNEVIPIWAVSHAGHQTEAEGATLPPTEGNASLYTLQGQIRHKAKFIDLYVPDNVHVILIGHSIGAYISQELIKTKDQFSSQVLQFFLLFPTIMEMKKSLNGKFYTSTQSLHWLLLSVLTLVDHVPEFVRRSLVNFYLWLNYSGMTGESRRAILTLLQKSTFERVLVMADSEMVLVRDLDVDFLKTNQARMFIYFGKSDGWCPLDFVRSMILQVPNLRHVLCQEGIPHAFVLDKSRRMAEILVEQIANSIIQ